MKKAIKCGTLILAASILASAYKDEITNAVKSAAKLIKSCDAGAKKKPLIALLYESDPCRCKEIYCCNDDCSEESYDEADCNDECCNNECCNNDNTECTCGCDIEAYKNLFCKYSKYVSSVLIDTAKICPSEYIERFNINVVPTVLLLTPKGNLIAKLEIPESICEVEDMIKKHLRIG